MLPRSGLPVAAEVKLLAHQCAYLVHMSLCLALDLQAFQISKLAIAWFVKRSQGINMSTKP